MRPCLRGTRGRSTERVLRGVCDRGALRSRPAPLSGFVFEHLAKEAVLYAGFPISATSMFQDSKIATLELHLPFLRSWAIGFNKSRNPEQNTPGSPPITLVCPEFSRHRP